MAGISVVEISGGIAAAYCGRLLADAGASVTSFATLKGAAETIDSAGNQTERLYAAYLSAGKRRIQDNSAGRLSDLCRDADIVIIGEAATPDLNVALPKIATVELTWFGKKGPYSGWKASDLIIQSLTAMPHLAGAVAGPPVHSGYRQSALIGGVTAYIAAIASIVAPARSTPRRFTVNLFEANLVLSEMDIHFVERDAVPLKRQGVNRFSPNSPVGILPLQRRLGWDHCDHPRAVAVALPRPRPARTGRRCQPVHARITVFAAGRGRERNGRSPSPQDGRGVGSARAHASRAHCAGARCERHPASPHLPGTSVAGVTHGGRKALPGAQNAIRAY